MILKKGDKWVIELSNGHTEVFTSEKAAKERLAQIEFFKHNKKGK